MCFFTPEEQILADTASIGISNIDIHDGSISNTEIWRGAWSQIPVACTVERDDTHSMEQHSLLTGSHIVL